MLLILCFEIWDTRHRKDLQTQHFLFACGWMELRLSPSLGSLSSLSSHYRFCYKVLTILVIGILACFCLRLAELWVNISSVKLTPKLTFLFLFSPLFSWKMVHRNPYVLLLSWKQTISNSKFRTIDSGPIVNILNLIFCLVCDFESC